MPRTENVTVKVKELKLSRRQKLFCENITSGCSHDQAYINAGYEVKGKTTEQIRSQAYIVYRVEKVKKYIYHLESKNLANAIITKKETLTRLAAIARFDMRQVAEWDNETITLKDSKCLDGVYAYGVDKVKIMTNKNGSITEIRGCDKIKALSRILDHYEKLEADAEDQFNSDEEYHSKITDRLSKYLEGN